MPRWPRRASGLISGTTSGTLASMRNAEELSTTMVPAPAALGANSRDTEAPAENRARSIPSQEASFTSRTSISSSAKVSRVPAERWLAYAVNASIGKARCSNVRIICRPTAPVAPTTATRRVTLLPSPALDHAVEKLTVFVESVGRAGKRDHPPQAVANHGELALSHRRPLVGGAGDLPDHTLGPANLDPPGWSREQAPLLLGVPINLRIGLGVDPRIDLLSHHEHHSTLGLRSVRIGRRSPDLLSALTPPLRDGDAVGKPVAGELPLTGVGAKGEPGGETSNGDHERNERDDAGKRTRRFGNRDVEGFGPILPPDGSPHHGRFRGQSPPAERAELCLLGIVAATGRADEHVSAPSARRSHLRRSVREGPGWPEPHRLPEPRTRCVSETWRSSLR